MSRPSLAFAVCRPLSIAAVLGVSLIGALSSTSGASAGQYGPDECRPGYVWREARPGDHVCVTPDERTRARIENRIQEGRIQPGGGAYGPKTCLNGFVWREAFDGDTVCVPPSERRRAKMNNAEADARYKY